MTGEEKSEIRKRVDKEIETLKKSIATLSELIEEEVQSDANDWFTTKENSGKEINDQALAKARQRLNILNEVLKRIDSPDFGICTVCKKPIPFERLKALPSATRCISC